MDYTSFQPGKKDKPPAKVNAEAPAKKWWEESGNDTAHAITQTIAFLQNNQITRLQQLSLATKLYGNVAYSAFPFTSSIAPLAAVQRTYFPDRVTFNVIQSCADTFVAKMSKNRPAPLYLTNGGDYRKRRKAQKLNLFTTGMFSEGRVYDLGPQIQKDACIWGDGFVQVLEQDDRVVFNRCLPHEIWVDQWEAMLGRPMQMHRVRPLDRSIALNRWKKHADAIKNAPAAKYDAGSVYPTLSDTIVVRESWRLPSTKDAKDGLHIISIDGETLFREEWEHDFFPIAQLSYSSGLFGFYGQSMTQRLQSIQLEINRILQTIQESFRLSGSFKVWVKTGSKLVPGQLNNVIGQVINSLEKPEYIVPPIVPVELYTQLKELIQRAYEQEGVSQLAAASVKPSGLDSKPALREFSDIQSDRFSVQGHAYERFFLDLARLGLVVSKAIFEKTGHYKVSADEKRFAKDIDWKEINLDDDDYITQVFPISSLPNTPEGRTQTIQEWVQAGWLSPRAGRRLMAFPDLQAEQTLMEAREEYAYFVLDKIIEENEYTAPEPYDDLDIFRELTLQEYALGKAHGLPEDRLEKLRQLLSQLDVYDQVKQQQLATMAQAAGQPGNPQAPPVPPQPSPLVPNVTGAKA